MLTAEHLATLRAVTEDATPGKRTWNTTNGLMITDGVVMLWARERGGIGCCPEDRAHIAAFDRETCLALLDEIETARAMLAAAVSFMLPDGRRLCQIWAPWDGQRPHGRWVITANVPEQLAYTAVMAGPFEDLASAWQAATKQQQQKEEAPHV